MSWRRDSLALALVVSIVLAALMVSAQGRGPDGAVLGSQPLHDPASASSPGMEAAEAQAGATAADSGEGEAAAPTVPGWVSSHDANHSNRPVAIPQTPWAGAFQGPISLVELRVLLEQSSWPDYTHARVERLVECESRRDPDAVGDGGRAMGLLQVRADVHRDLAVQFDLLDARDNLEAAYLVWERAGHSFGPWSCR